MTARRNAEQAVIVAARNALDGCPGGMLSLAKAMHRLDSTIETPAVRASIANETTDTSADAGHSVLGVIKGQAQQCFDEIAIVADSGGRGLTVDQVEQLLNMPHQTASARVHDLRNKGWVIDSGIKRKTRSGRNAIVWTPTELALQKGRW